MDEERAMRICDCIAVVLLVGLCLAGPRSADDTLRIAVGQRGLWDTAVPELGQRGSIFRKHGIVLDILYTQGGGETQQAVISGSVELGSAAGAMGVFGAYAKGAPLRVIGAETTGGAGLFWYVRAEFADPHLAGHCRQDDRVFHRRRIDPDDRQCLHQAVQSQGEAGRDRQSGLDPDASDVRPNRCGLGGAAVRPRSPRSGQDPDRANGGDAIALQNLTVRFLITNAATLRTREAAVGRFMAAYRETVDWMYADLAVLRHYAEFLGISEAAARRSREGFYPKAALEPDTIAGIDAINADAVAFKYMAAPLTPAQLADLIRVPPR